MKNTNRKAFTLVELVIVIAVIAILAGVMIPTFGAIIKNAHISNDTSTAASINIAIAAKLEGINNVTDLNDAIDIAFGTDYHKVIEPKSAKYGYHFFYDVEQNKVVLSTFDDLGSIPIAAVNEAEQFGVMACAANADSKISFKDDVAGNLRFHQNRFYLLDATGDIVDEMNGIDKEVSDSINGTTGSENLDDVIKDLVGSDDPMSDAMLEQLTNVAIVTNTAIYIYGNPDDVKAIRFADGLTTVPENAIIVLDTDGNPIENAPNYIASHDNIKSFTLPESVTTVHFRGLMFKENEKVVIKTGLTVDNIISVFKAGSTNAIIEAFNNNQYKVVDNQLININDATEKYTLEYSKKLESFDISFTNTSDANLTKTTEDGVTKYTLYIAENYASNVKLVANTFKELGKDGTYNTFTSEVYWSWSAEDGTVIGSSTGESIEINFADLSDKATITVRSQDVYYEIPVAIEHITAIDVYNVAGNTMDSFDGEGDSYTQVFYLNYSDTKSWDLVPLISQEYNGIVSLNFDVKLSDESVLKYTHSDKKLSLVDTNTTGAKTVDVTFDCVISGTNKKVSSKTVRFILDDKPSNFTVADNANINANYGVPFKVGTGVISDDTVIGGNVPFSTIFAAKAGSTLGSKVTVTIPQAALKFEGNSASDAWKNANIEFSKLRDEIDEPQEILLNISDGGAFYKFTLTIIPNAYNVSNESDWENMPDGTSNIAVLKSFSVEDTTLTIKEDNPFPTGKGYYSKNLGSDVNIHGNLCTIKFGTFTIVKQSNSNYFLGINSGTIENLLIEGPKYNKAVLYGDGDKTGMYIHGIYKTGTGTLTVSNSYISGFRASIRLDAGTLKLPNTTLKGGAIANLYDYGSAKMVFDNTTMIQYYENGCLGAGVFVDSAATNSEVVINNGGLHQYTWGSESEAKNLPIIADLPDLGILGDLADLGVSFLKSNIGTHKLAGKGTTEYLHLGFVLDPAANIKTGSSTWSDGGKPISGYLFKNVVVADTTYLKGCVLQGESSSTETQHTGSSFSHTMGWCSCPSVTTWSDNCANCDGSSGTHIYFPDSNNDGAYTSADFLATFND